jgi:hypothetical protein
MIFISGTIIPLEFLNPAIAFIGKITPLYIVIEFTEKMFFRSVDLIDVLFNYIYLIAYTALNILLAMIAYVIKR